MLDLRDMKQIDIDTLLSLGVPPLSIVKPYPPMVTHGNAHQGAFEPTAAGQRWFAFGGLTDIVLWQPESGTLLSEWGRAFALGEELIDNPAATFDGWLRVFADPADWMRNNRQGIVVLKWAWAFDSLCGLPGVAVDPKLLPAYRRAMKPKLPRLAVLPSASERKVA